MTGAPRFNKILNWEPITKAALYTQRAAELEAMAQSAPQGEDTVFRELAEGYRRLAGQPASLAIASDAEIEMLATRMAGRSIVF